jgi:glycosyltransferase involved in cell wall biosynthesis
MYDDVPTEPVSMPGLTTAIARSSRRRTSSGAVPIESPALIPRDHTDARLLAGLADLPTIVAMGPFDDLAHAQQLTAAFVTVRRSHEVQLVLLGPGVQRTAIMRRILAQGFGSSVHAFKNSCDDRSSHLLAAADVVLLSASSGTTALLDALAAGRPVVAPADPATVGMVVPGIAGLVYAPGDGSAMTAALLRLMTAPALRRGMGGRARNIARRHHLETTAREVSKKGRRA